MERNQSIDLVKIVAMFGVISLHCCLGRLDNPIAFVMSRLSGISIPLFFMVSGYLLVGKDGNYKYTLRKIFGIIKFVFIITASYGIIYSIVKGFDIKKILLFFFGSFVQKGPFWMFWYFGAMCLIYLFLPILLYMKRRVKYFFLKLLVLLVCIDFIVFISTLLFHFEYNIIQSFRLWNWVTYFSLGALVKELLDHNKVIMKLDALWCILFAVLFIIFVYYCRPYIGGVEYFFTTPLCMVYAVWVFITILKLDIKDNKYIEQLSLLFLPVYTIHFFIIKIFRYYIHIDSIGYISVLIDWVFVSAITISISLILMKNRFIESIFRI